MKSCDDCNMPSDKFPILTTSEEVWIVILEDYRYKGKKPLLCPTCLCKRIKKFRLTGVVCRLP